MINKLRLVEIELFSYCNRSCNWCPNREIDRKSHNHLLDPHILLKLLTELKVNKYEGPITFSRYNEPLSHMSILRERLSVIKSVLPKNKLITNTNGDFVNKDSLRALPLDELTIMDYDRKGLDKCKQILEDAGAVITEISHPYIYAHYGDMQILYFVNWLDKKTITDRGGFLKEYSESVRKSPCYEPLYFVGVNYDGTVSPCCNIRNDIDTLRDHIIGDLNKNTLKEILSSPKSLQFRDDCKNAIFREGSPCYCCSNKGGRYTQGGNGIRYE